MSTNQPPPIPERPGSSGYNGFSSYPSYPSSRSFNPYMGNSFGMYDYSGGGGYLSGGSPYYGMGSYRGGYGTGSGMTPTPAFVRLAEENTRPAFETILSIVQSFNSVSMMFESCYFALHSSFRAMLSVVEHMTRAKVQLSQIFSAFTAFRVIKYLYMKFRQILGLSVLEDPSVFLASAELDSQFENAATASLDRNNKGKNVNWPILIYSGLTLAAPFFMWRLVSSFVNSEADSGRMSGKWMTGETEHFVGKVLYDFRARRQDEISVEAGQEVRVAPRNLQPRIRGWLLGSVDGQREGLFPANYVRMLGKKIPEREGSKPDLILKSNGKEDDSKGFQEVFDQVK